jgi:hypothetical protein
MAWGRMRGEDLRRGGTTPPPLISSSSVPVIWVVYVRDMGNRVWFADRSERERKGEGGLGRSTLLPEGTRLAARGLQECGRADRGRGSGCHFPVAAMPHIPCFPTPHP